jgi:hypothetical protein
MSIFDPRQISSDVAESDDVARGDTPLPTRFGRDARQRWRPRLDSRPVPRIGEPLPAPDDERPFEDDGGL